MHLARLAPPVALVLTCLACSSSDESIDPTSPRALKKADSIMVSCQYEERVIDSTSSYLRPGCMQHVSCDDINSPPSQIVIGGNLYNDHSVPKTNLKPIMGDCGTGTPITCDAYASSGNDCDACVAKSCCAPAYLCDHDPNCQAIYACVKDSGDDSARIQRCVDNGDYEATQNFKKLVACWTGSCAAACQ